MLSSGSGATSRSRHVSSNLRSFGHKSNAIYNNLAFIFEIEISQNRYLIEILMQIITQVQILGIYVFRFPSKSVCHVDSCRLLCALVDYYGLLWVATSGML